MLTPSLVFIPDCVYPSVFQIPSLAGFTNLRRVEFSYNEIRSLSPLEELQGTTGLQELYVASNKASNASTLQKHYLCCLS